MKVSIIVPIYKTAKYLMQCINSIRCQTLNDIEIILIDEGDDDECYAIMRLQQTHDSRIKIIHEKNGGYGASCNKGIEIAQGEYIGIVESDDFIEDTMYEEMYSKAAELDVDILKIPFYYYDESINGIVKRICDYNKWITSVSPKEAFNIFDFPQQLSVHASNWAGIYKKDFLYSNNIKFINAPGASYVDVGFRIDTFIAAKKIAWLPRPLYNYRIGNADSSTNNFNLDAMLKRWHEAHEEFENKYCGTYDKIGSYLFYDEFINTCEYFFKIPTTINQLKAVQHNMSYVSDDVINTICNGKLIGKSIKCKVNILRKANADSNFNRFNIFTIAHRLRYTKFIFSIGLNHIKILINTPLNRNILSWEFSIFNKFHIHCNIK
jgi:glycosyltransferase involved in cell wall biosynthesis